MRIMTAKYKLSIFFTLILFFTLYSNVFAATPSVLTNTYKVSGSNVPRYSKFEASFSISKTYPAIPLSGVPGPFDSNALLPYYYYDPSDTPLSDPGRNSPYGVDGISIDANITTPSGKSIKLPAFYYQQVNRTGSVNSYELNETTNFDWRFRYSPSELGTYNYYVTIQDKDGTTRYPSVGTLQFTSVNSDSPGFLRVSSRDPRFFEFDSGKTFVPVGSGLQWSLGGGSYGYESFFDTWKTYGINFTRIWFQNDGFNISLEGRYDKYIPPSSGDPDAWKWNYNPIDNGIDVFSLTKGTQINQRSATEIDKIVESAERNGVYIVYSAHGDAHWIWDAAVWDTSGDNVNWNPNPARFNDKDHINYWKRNFRYRVARWGYSTSIGAWETWNEHGHITTSEPEYSFYQQYGQFQQQQDVYNHIRTTSQNSQAFSPGLWSMPTMGAFNYHDYADFRGGVYTSLSSDEVDLVKRFSWCLRDSSYNGKNPGNTSSCTGLGLGDGSTWSGNTKPMIWGEYGLWNQSGTPIQSGEAGIRFTHNIVWAGALSPTTATPLDWYADLEDAATRTSKYNARKSVSEFFKNEDLAGMNVQYLINNADKPSGYSSDVLGLNNSALRAYGIRSGDKKKTFVWVQNRNYVWTKTGTPSAVNDTLTIPNLPNGNYTAQYWDTVNATISSTRSITVTNGNASIPLTGISKDIAIKLVSGDTSNPTPTPTPSSVPSPTPSPTSLPTPTPLPTYNGLVGDVNLDGSINIQDILDLVSELFNR